MTNLIVAFHNFAIGCKNKWRSCSTGPCRLSYVAFTLCRKQKNWFILQRLNFRTVSWKEKMDSVGKVEKFQHLET